MPSQSSACILPCTVQSLSLICLYEWTLNIHCRACLQWTFFHLWMPLPISQLLKRVRHDHLMLHIALHATPMHLYHGKLPFSHMNDVPLQSSTSECDCQCKNAGIWNACVFQYIHHNLMITFTSTRHIFSNIYTPFLAIPYVRILGHKYSCRHSGSEQCAQTHASYDFKKWKRSEDLNIYNLNNITGDYICKWMQHWWRTKHTHTFSS